MSPTLNQAIVIGGSFSGLFAAVVLSRHFKNVCIIERDPLDDQGVPRRGVPQGRHAHLLLKSGAMLIEELLPGILDELVAQGGHKIDFSEHVAWHAYGSWKPRHSSGFHIHIQSRPLFESVVRARVREISNVNFQVGKTVTDILYDPKRKCVKGIEFASNRKDQHKVQLFADLVVDASGRASSIPSLMESWGFSRVKTTSIRADLQYATRAFKAPDPDTYPWKMMALNHSAPSQTRSGMLLPSEHGRCLVTLVGYLGDHPPKDLDGFLNFSKKLPTPDLYEVISALEPDGDGALHRFPYARRLRYDKLRDHPGRLIATGDAVCSFDPVFGQGITMAATAAHTLEQWLERGQVNAPGKFYKSLSRAHRVPWALAKIEDLRYPQIEGRRPFGLKGVQKYISCVMDAASKDTHVYQKAVGAFHLVDSPMALVSPRVVLQAMRLFFRKDRNTQALSPFKDNPAHSTIRQPSQTEGH